MASGLVDIMKRAAMDAMDNQQPTDLRVGTVVSVKPLRVQITNQLTIPESLLIVPESLTDHSVDVTVEWVTVSKSGGSGESAFSSHNHSISGKKQMTVHNALKVGDKVALIRKHGGQSYFILDRIKN